MGDQSTILAVFREGFSWLPRISTIVISRAGLFRFLLRDGKQPDRAHRLKDLRMTLEETEGIARLYAKKISVETVRYLHYKSDGWVAGLVLLLTKTDKET
jgi:hypothetical protein